jgi:hypothetical protein
MSCDDKNHRDPKPRVPSQLPLNEQNEADDRDEIQDRKVKV